MLYKDFDHIDELDIYMNDYKYIIINISAAWCKPCKSIAPALEKFIKETKCDENFLFLKCDFDIICEFQSFIDEYQVEKIPYFIFIERGVMTKSCSTSNIESIEDHIRDFIIRNSTISQNSFHNDDF